MALHLQLGNQETEGWGARAIRPSLRKMAIQTCLERTQETRVCLLFHLFGHTGGQAAGIWLSSLNKAISCTTSVLIVSWMKNLQLQSSGAQVFHVCNMFPRCKTYRSVKKATYADFDGAFSWAPEGSDMLIINCGSGTILSMKSQMWRYLISSGIVNAPFISETHAGIVDTWLRTPY